jgi:hypothetical protein
VLDESRPHGRLRVLSRAFRLLAEAAMPTDHKERDLAMALALTGELTT